jgi:hypothetical protein
MGTKMDLKLFARKSTHDALSMLVKVALIDYGRVRSGNVLLKLKLLLLLLLHLLMMIEMKRLQLWVVVERGRQVVSELCLSGLDSGCC